MALLGLTTELLSKIALVIVQQTWIFTYSHGCDALWRGKQKSLDPPGEFRLSGNSFESS